MMLMTVPHLFTAVNCPGDSVSPRLYFGITFRPLNSLEGAEVANLERPRNMVEEEEIW